MITCVIPARNPDPSLLKVTVRSALDAGVNEVVIVDDCSAEPIVYPRARVKVMRLPHAKGETVAFCAGVAAANHDWIARLAVGDAMLPSKTRQVLATAAAGARASYSDCHVVGEGECAPGPFEATSSTVMHVSALDEHTLVDWHYFPEVTAIVAAASTNESKPCHGSRNDSRPWADATAVTAGTVEDE